MVQSHPDSLTARAFGRVVRKLLGADLEKAKERLQKRGGTIKIAVPAAQGTLSPHFGHCEEFVLFEVDLDTSTIRDRQALKPPAHEPGVLPRWLHELGANVVLTGGIGARAQSLLAEQDIAVVDGLSPADPTKIVESYLDGTLEAGASVCDH
jgi:predicted Fe-Mo cluster-binding NifX family protein